MSWLPPCRCGLEVVLLHLALGLSVHAAGGRDRRHDVSLQRREGASARRERLDGPLDRGSRGGELAGGLSNLGTEAFGEDPPRDDRVVLGAALRLDLADHASTRERE